MKVLLVGAGSGFSTKDVEMGYYEAFQQLDVDLSFYMLDQRIGVASKWLKYNWKHLFHSDPLRKPTWAEAVYRGGIEALEMALRYDVDFVFVISAMYLHSDVIIMMRRAGLKVGVLFTESPYQDEQQAIVAQYVDVAFTNERTSIPFLRQYNTNTHYLQHAYSPERHRRPPRTTGAVEMGSGQLLTTLEETPLASHDVVFVGTGFQERIDLLTGVDWEGIDLGLYGVWSMLPPKHKLRKFVKGSIMTNMKAHELYSQAQIGLNLYRTSKEYIKKPDHIYDAESLNPRAYELAASGTFCLTDYRLEGWETFRTSQPFFSSPEQLQEYLRCYLGGERIKKSNVDEAHERVQGHTFLERAKQVLEHA